MKEGGKVSFKLVKARENTTIMLQETERILDFMALLINILIIRALFGSAVARWNVGLRVFSDNKITKLVAVVPFIGKEPLKF